MYQEKSRFAGALAELRLKKLTESQVEQIDEIVRSLGDQGEVHLIVQRGVLKYINKVEKHKSWDANEQD